MLFQIVDDGPFFGRETEQAHLLAQLKGKPYKILSIVGPRSSGKSRLLREVLLSDRLDTPVTFLTGGVAKLSHLSVLIGRLWRDLDVHLDALKVLQNGLRDVAKAAIMNKLWVGSWPAPASTACPMNKLMVAYGELLTVRREASGSPPVICIDDAHVLMGWDESDWHLQSDLEALLYFFVQVSDLLAAAHHCLVVTMSDWMQGLQWSTQICAKLPRAHVIFATSDSTFYAWLGNSE